MKAEIWRQAGADDGDVPDHDHLAEHWPAFIADLQRLTVRVEAQMAARSDAQRDAARTRVRGN